jgi:hypothetical protein
MTNKFYVYGYLREDGTPYYIGKGSGHRVTKCVGRIVHPPKDKDRIIIYKDNLSEDDAFDLEKQLIAEYGRKDNHTGILHNKTMGGEGKSKNIIDPDKTFEVLNLGKNIFNCLACGRENPIRGGSYQSKYCNNQCQQDHRKRLLQEKRIEEWKSDCSVYNWKAVPEYVRDYLIEKRGHKCEMCGNQTWMDKPIPLLAEQRDRNPYNNVEENLEVTCFNCKAQK